MRIVVGAALFLVLNVKANAQTDSLKRERKAYFSIGARAHYGVLVPHTPDLKALGPYYPWGIEIDANWRLLTEGAYRFCSCYPRVGASFNYFYFDNNRILGQAAFMVLYAEPVFFYRSKVNLSIRAALVGLGGMTTPYDSITNPTNKAYGLPIGFPLILSMAVHWNISPNVALRLGVGFNHLSNGSLKAPNRGLNFPTVSFGLDATFKPEPLVPRGKLRRPIPEKKNRIEIEMGNSAKSIVLNEKRHHWVYNVSLQYSRWLFRSVALPMAVIYESDYALKDEIANSARPGRDFQRVSMATGYEFWLWRFRFSQTVGFYVYDGFKDDGVWYHRTEFNVLITPWLHVGTGLKAHANRADYLDFKVGYSFAWADKKKR